MKTSKMFLLMAISLSILVFSCQSSKKDKPENLKDVAYDAFIYAYPMLRVYGGTEKFWDKSWTMPDVKLVK